MERISSESTVSPLERTAWLGVAFVPEGTPSPPDAEAPADVDIGSGTL
jgi:hypothetical protein